jgi:hypothetical protein
MNNVVITVDIDWAPDFVIDSVAERLITYQVRATWFVTHASPAIERLRQYPDLFELGIHPNFLPGSTHGGTTETILTHCMRLVPTATSMRTHALIQSSPLLIKIMTQTPITTDVSLFLPYASFLHPVEFWWQHRRLVRIPYFWEDDLEMERFIPSWHLTPLLQIGEGLKIFDFHPIHIYLNSARMEPYQSLKQRVPRLVEATPSDVDGYIQADAGTNSLFTEIVEYLAVNGRSARIQDINAQWQLLKKD